MHGAPSFTASWEALCLCISRASEPGLAKVSHAAAWLKMAGQSWASAVDQSGHLPHVGAAKGESERAGEAHPRF